MTGLTFPTYRSHHHQLKQAWFTTNPYAFTLLSPTEQMALHDFYALTKSLTDADLKAHRESVSDADPSLPQRAGKAFAKIKPFLDNPPVPTQPIQWQRRQARPRRRRGEPRPQRVLEVTSLVRPEMDAAKVAKVLLSLAKQLEREAGEEEQSDRAA